MKPGVFLGGNDRERVYGGPLPAKGHALGFEGEVAVKSSLPDDLEEGDSRREMAPHVSGVA